MKNYRLSRGIVPNVLNSNNLIYLFSLYYLKYKTLVVKLVDDRYYHSFLEKSADKPFKRTL